MFTLFMIMTTLYNLYYYSIHEGGRDNGVVLACQDNHPIDLHTEGNLIGSSKKSGMGTTLP